MKYQFMNNSNIGSVLKDYAVITFGLLVCSIGWVVFMLPNHITQGGMPGVSSVLEWGLNIPVQYTYFASIRYGNAAAATILQYLMPVIIIGYTTMVTRKLPRYIELVCVAMAVGGTFLLVTHGKLDTLAIPLEALLWGLASAVAAAFYTMQPKRLIRKWRATLVVGWGMLLGGLALMPICPPWMFTGRWDSLSAIIYAYIIIFGTVTAFGCYLGSIKYIQPEEASILGSVEPLSAILLSVAFLNVSFGWMDILGATLVIGTVFLLAKK